MPPTPIQQMNALIGDPRCSQGWMAGCGRLVGAHHIFKHLSCDRYSKRGRAFRGALRKFYRLETPKGRQSFYRLVAVVRKIVVKINDKSCKNKLNLVQNPSKTDQKRSQINTNASLERFRRQIAHRSAPGRSPPGLTSTTWSPFWLKMVRRGSIFGALENPKSFLKRIFEA